jgi:hypothetical protein
MERKGGEEIQVVSRAGFCLLVVGKVCLNHVRVGEVMSKSGTVSDDLTLPCSLFLYRGVA